jgi:hypothetical protein
MRHYAVIATRRASARWPDMQHRNAALESISSPSLVVAREVTPGQFLLYQSKPCILEQMYYH